MKKMTTWSLVLASLLVVASGCSEHKTTTETTATTAAPAAGVATAYPCPRHPAVVTDRSGKCPKCGTDLLVKK